VLKPTLATHFLQSLPYIFSGLLPLPHHSAVQVNRQSGKLQLLNLLIEQFAVKPHQRARRGLRKLFEPIHHGAVSGNVRQPAQPREQQIVGDITQVAQPARADSPIQLRSSAGRGP
jgi:hypothetical protein